MNFDKPKVTIDLEEYQHLLDRVNGMDKDEMVVASKKILAAFLNLKGRTVDMGPVLEKEGIVFQLKPNQYGGFITHEDIIISLIKKNKQ